ncbi:MAG: DUF1800 domain-containing protein [Opitutaceae bacterium]|nr:DUF1800 domain-containing protein [Opitutaceae bacterium]
MESRTPTLAPAEAWQPLPARDWTPEAARHLLRRTGFSARPELVAQAAAAALPEVVAHLFTPSPPLPEPFALRKLAEEFRAFEAEGRPDSEAERRRRRREFQDKARAAFEDFGIAWLQRAADPKYSAYEKFVLFLQDIFVVAFQKVKNPVLLHAHQQLLREHGTAAYPELCKRVSRSPAMVQYLDLQQSRVEHPNENFARELLELFTLGEGNYSEDDIKEAARAFTGYRQRGGEFAFVRRQHDTGRKTIFGRTGAFDGDGVIDLIFDQPAAGRFLPRELVRFYLTDRPLPDEHLEAFAAQWRRDDYDTGKLLRRFFTSRLFFDPAFRGAMIKSPIHYYLGLVQDLDLDVAPFPRLTLSALRQMGQTFFNPPNVRGWVGGRTWINSTTLAARRQLVEWLFTPLDESKLNGDEMVELVAARADGHARFNVEDATLDSLRAMEPEVAAQTVIDRGFGAAPPAELRAAMAEQFAEAFRGGAGNERARALLGALLLSPHYQLC